MLFLLLLLSLLFLAVDLVFFESLLSLPFAVVAPFAVTPAALEVWTLSPSCCPCLPFSEQPTDPNIIAAASANTAILVFAADLALTLSNPAFSISKFLFSYSLRYIVFPPFYISQWNYVRFCFLWLKYIAGVFVLCKIKVHSAHRHLRRITARRSHWI